MNDNYELVTSIVDGTYVEGINLPLSKLERLQGELITDAIRNVINIVFDGGFAMAGAQPASALYQAMLDTLQAQGQMV